MRLATFSRGFGAILLSTGILTNSVAAAPHIPAGGAVQVQTSGTLSQSDVVNTLDMQPVASLPGTIGSVSYASDGKCIAIVLGGSNPVRGTDVDSIFFGKGAMKRLGLLKRSHSLVMCPGANGATEVILADAAGVKKLFAKKKPRADGSSIIRTVWDRPNMLATALVGNRVVVNGAKFISNDYDIHFGTDGNGRVQFLILDRVARKLIAFHQDVGGYYGDLTPARIALIHERWGLAIAQALKIILAD